MKARGWRQGIARLVRAPLRLWWSSLPLRVVASTLSAAILILLGSGWVLMQQATAGVLDGKKRSAIAEASVALEGLQVQLRTSDPRAATLNQRLTQLARDAANRGSVGGQYQVVLAGPVSDIASTGVDTASVPEMLRGALADSDGLWVTPTRVRYTDGRAPEPGLVVGANLVAPGSGRYPLFFIFPLTQETQTLAVLQGAAVTTGLLVLLALGGIVFLVSRQVGRPVRAARLAAERIASGRLTDRLRVRGTDDFARLALSMNHMAQELAGKIAQLENLSRVQHQFVSDVSHELRTPLTTVRMAAEILHDSRYQFDAVPARSAELLLAEVDRFESLLADLLEISRFDAGVAELALDEVDLTELVRDELNAHAPFAARMGTPLRLHASGPCLAEVDARRIRRILRNLITNAIEHGERRPIDVFVNADAGAVAVAVRDHGVGFLASQSHQVFNRFWRADPARARTVGGSGLGLSIALEDARLHGGWLNAWGRPHRGAQFRLTLPRRPGSTPSGSPIPVVPADGAGFTVPQPEPAPSGEEVTA